MIYRLLNLQPFCILSAAAAVRMLLGFCFIILTNLSVVSLRSRGITFRPVCFQCHAFVRLTASFLPPSGPYAVWYSAISPPGTHPPPDDADGHPGSSGGSTATYAPDCPEPHPCFLHHTFLLLGTSTRYVYESAHTCRAEAETFTCYFVFPSEART